MQKTVILPMGFLRDRCAENSFQIILPMGFLRGRCAENSFRLLDDEQLYKF